MGKNVYVTPKNRDKWNNTREDHKASDKGGQQQTAAERTRLLAEKYKQQKQKKENER